MSDIATGALLALAVTVLGRLAIYALERIFDYISRKIGYWGEE